MMIVITLRCLWKLLLHGQEWVDLDDGRRVRIVLKGRDEGTPPGFRGDGFYISEDR
jgi:hypothetical protein